MQRIPRICFYAREEEQTLPILLGIQKCQSSSHLWCYLFLVSLKKKKGLKVGFIVINPLSESEIAPIHSPPAHHQKLKRALLCNGLI